MGTPPQVFKGPDAIKHFLHPQAPTPLVELPISLNPFYKDGVRVFAKLHNMSPLANVKAIPAYNILEEARKQKKLKAVDTIIEYSSGNTILSAAVIARHFGIHKSQTVISHEAFWSRIQLLRFLGVEVLVHNEPEFPKKFDKRSGIEKALQLGKRKNYFCLRQYENEANPEAHEKWTGPQLWKQTQGALTIFCSGMGTTGTIVGTSKYLKKQNKKIVTVGITRKVNSPVPGVRSKPRLKLIHYDWEPYVDVLEEIGLKESYTTSLELCRAGIFVGPSSGFALAGLYEFLRKQKEAGTLKNHKHKDGKIHAAFICCDGPFQYLEEYFDYVDKNKFPSVKNDHLLLNHPH